MQETLLKFILDNYIINFGKTKNGFERAFVKNTAHEDYYDGVNDSHCKHYTIDEVLEEFEKVK